MVKSHGERLIANFVFLNGVNYVYEQPYEIARTWPTRCTRNTARTSTTPTSTSGTSTGHFDRDGKLLLLGSLATRAGHGVEAGGRTPSTGRHSSSPPGPRWCSVTVSRELKDELSPSGRHASTGVRTDRSTTPGTGPVRHEDLARLVRTFMAHVKSNSSTAGDSRADD